MTALYNKKDKATLLRDLENETFQRITLSFYRYVPLDNLQDLRDELYAEWQALGVLGRVYIATEGINAQISVPEHAIDAFRQCLNARPEFQDMPFKLAVEDGLSFIKLVIKVRHEIVAYQIPADEYDITKVGNHLSAIEFNQAMDNGAVVVDMRNQYEAEVGHFENAIIPNVERSQELLAEAKRLLEGHENDKVLLYCTGGIRCEKASAYLMQNGFKDVNQLHGGIIQYAHEVKNNNADSKFIGKNFVFDGRMGERITDDVIAHCHQCGTACDEHTDCANKQCNILFIQCAQCSDRYDGCCSEVCADFLQLPLEERQQLFKNGKILFSAQKYGRVWPHSDDATV